MRGTALIVFVAAFALSFTFDSPHAWAQFDHLQCHKVKDTMRFKGTVVDLEATQAAFQVPSNCAIKGAATKICVPVGKSVVDWGDAPGSFIGPGVDLTPNAYVCYKMKCQQQTCDDTLVTDPFGVRVLEKIKFAQELCVPAVMGVVTNPGCALGEPEACQAFGVVSECMTCCDENTQCNDACSLARFSLGCAQPSRNALCAEAVNAAGCDEVCCP